MLSYLPNDQVNLYPWKHDHKRHPMRPGHPPYFSDSDSPNILPGSDGESQLPVMDEIIVERHSHIEKMPSIEEVSEPPSPTSS